VKVTPTHSRPLYDDEGAPSHGNLKDDIAIEIDEYDWSGSQDLKNNINHI
jgi:hypothetical protein